MLWEHLARDKQIILARKSPACWSALCGMGAWKCYKHCKIVNHHLMDLADKHSKRNRLIIVQHPQTGKTWETSIGFSTWYLGTNPGHNVAITSYNSDRAIEIGAACREQFSEFAEPVFGLKIDPSTASKQEWKVDGHPGKMYSVGLHGGLTGKRVNCLVVDDLFKDYEDASSPIQRETVFNWWYMVARARLTDHAIVLFCNTRWHPEDHIGLIKQTKKIEYLLEKRPVTERVGEEVPSCNSER